MFAVTVTKHGIMHPSNVIDHDNCFLDFMWGQPSRARRKTRDPDKTAPAKTINLYIKANEIAKSTSNDLQSLSQATLPTEKKLLPRPPATTNDAFAV